MTDFIKCTQQQIVTQQQQIELVKPKERPETIEKEQKQPNQQQHQQELKQQQQQPKQPQQQLFKQYFGLDRLQVKRLSK